MLEIENNTEDMRSAGEMVQSCPSLQVLSLKCIRVRYRGNLAWGYDGSFEVVHKLPGQVTFAVHEVVLGGQPSRIRNKYRLSVDIGSERSV